MHPSEPNTPELLLETAEAPADISTCELLRRLVREALVSIYGSSVFRRVVFTDAGNVMVEERESAADAWRTRCVVGISEEGYNLMNIRGSAAATIVAILTQHTGQAPIQRGRTNRLPPTPQRRRSS